MSTSCRDAPLDQKWQRISEEVQLRALGASVISEFAGHHVVMADPAGNEFCVAR